MLSEAEWLFEGISRLRADVVAPLGFVIALAVTIHVLLNKRDVAAAIGWIGLAWLSPVLGGIVYFIFGVNRVRRRARQLRDGAADDGVPDALPPAADRDPDLAPLELATRHLTRRPALAGNAVRLFRNGDQAYPPMLEAIEAARESIALSTYILHDDAAGARFIDALIAAQKRGIAVRVIIDGIGSGYFSSAPYRRLLHGGVPVQRFMHSPLPWRMPFLNLRTHKKVLLVDGRRGFAGGMNISAQNLVATGPRHPVRDTHFSFDGPVVGQLAEAFAGDWEFLTGETLAGPAWFADVAPAGDAVARVVTSGPDEDIEKVELTVLQAVACARHSIRLMTPYFLPDERMMTALSLAATRGVAVEIVLPEVSDHRVIDWALRAHVGPLLEEGCRIWFNPPPFDHSKVLVVDGKWALVGSANWDMRSFRLNFELTVELYDQQVCAELEAQIEAAKGKPLTLEALAARPLPLRLLHAGTRLLLPYL